MRAHTTIQAVDHKTIALGDLKAFVDAAYRAGGSDDSGVLVNPPEYVFGTPDAPSVDDMKIIFTFGIETQL